MMSRSEPVAASDAIDARLDPLTERALEWLVHLHSGSETEQDWNAFHDWKASGAAQRQAAEAAERLWEGLGSALRRRRRAKAAVATVLSACLLAAIGLGFATGLFGAPVAYFTDEWTGVGERRVLTLSDGSRLELDAATSLDVGFTPAQRRLVLFGGRIHVTVAADPGRPFVVEAAGGTTRALGTAFEVSRAGDQVEVVVTEHAVRVAYPDDDPGASVEVHAGSEVDYAPQTGLAHPRTADLRSRGAWRRGMLLLDSRPLGDVVTEIERYRRGRIVIADPALRQLPVSGMFETADTDALLDALATALPVRVAKLPWLTVIRRDPDRPLQPFLPRK